MTERVPAHAKGEHKQWRAQVAGEHLAPMRFDEPVSYATAKKAFRARDGKRWGRRFQFVMLWPGRAANPANVGGASSGALQARGRQGNPDWDEESRREIIKQIREVRADLETEYAKIYRVHQWEADSLPSDKQLANKNRTAVDLRDWLSDMKAELKRVRALPDSARLKNPRKANPDHVFGRGKYPPASKIKDHRYKQFRAMGYGAKDAKEYADAVKWASDNDVEYEWYQDSSLEAEEGSVGWTCVARRGDDVASAGVELGEYQQPGGWNGTPAGKVVEADLAMELRGARRDNPTDSADWSLDGTDPDDLARIAAKIKRREAVFGAKTTKQLTTYCRSKARAMKLREAGQINEAVALENQCDRIYKQLPKWAKW